MEKSLWIISLYDVSDGFHEEWERYETIYCVAADIEKAQKLVKKNIGENQVIVSISQMQNQKVFVD